MKTFTLPDFILDRLTIDGVRFNSLAAAYRHCAGLPKATPTEDEQELDVFILQNWASHLQRAETAQQDRQSAAEVAAIEEAGRLTGLLEETKRLLSDAENNASILSSSMEQLRGTHKSEVETLTAQFREELRIARLPGPEQEKELIARRQQKLAEAQAALSARLEQLNAPAVEEPVSAEDADKQQAPANQ